jgi:nitrilase
VSAAGAPRVAALQMTSGADVAANLREAERLIAAAAADGATLAVLPENFALMGQTEQAKLGLRERDGDGPLQQFLAAQARRHAIWLVGGTLPLAGDDPGRVRAACLLYDAAGRRVARYDKLHLFDVEVADSGERYVESETIEPGTTPVVADTPFGRLGLAVCYDLRFPELFRRMLDDGMELLALPSAFTAATGRAHWDVLLRARAIENLCHVIAAAQGGMHANGRQTHGDSLVADPWGRVVARREHGPGVVAATLDRARQASLRASFPVLAHRRLTCR